MSFSSEWEILYGKNAHMSSWPWSDLVSMVMRFAKPSKDNFKILELGCGAGANIPFFINLGVQYFSIDGSATIIKKLKEKFPTLKENLLVGDFINEIPFETSFDLVVDRASVTCNSTKNIQKCLNMVYDKLKDGGKFIGIDWYSTECSDYDKGTKLDDDFTCTGHKEGEFANIGIIHFSNKPHLMELFKKFNILHLEHKIIKKEYPDDKHILASWNIVVEKKKT